MSFIDVIIAQIVPHDCLQCGVEGDLLCFSCHEQLPKAPMLCYKCGAPSLGGMTCSICLLVTDLTEVRVVTNYDGVAKNLLYKLKLAGTQAAASVIARKLHEVLGDLDPDSIIVPVPTATSRVRQRGYDQARLIARELSKLTGIPCYSVLARSGQRHQHGLSRRERLTQLTDAYRVTKPYMVQARPIILIDDVMTTGATLEAAAHVMAAAGATHVGAIVFAQPLVRPMTASQQHNID
ncbi:MAG: phosphoribosyltransferase family protein [Patescibacteria group bacterium]